MQQGSFRFPDNCPDADCDFLVTYQASGDNSVVFELRGRGNWAGVGFSEDNQMVSITSCTVLATKKTPQYPAEIAE